MKSPPWQSVVELDGKVWCWPQFYSSERAVDIQARLLEQLKWGPETIHMFGRAVLVPRLVCWYGDPGATYRYSGAQHEPMTWTPLLTEIRRDIEHASGCAFNSVLANQYRDGNDSMGWHADNEPELGAAPTIASLSLGASRRFRLQHRKTKRAVTMTLSTGDLILMEPPLQSHWRHSIPKATGCINSRINLTFRRIVQT